MMRALIAAVLMLALAPAFASQSTKDAKLAHLMELQGLNDVIRQQQEAGQKQAAQICADTLEQLKKQMPDMDPQTTEDIGKASQQFIADAKPTWTAEEAVAAYARFYGEQLGEHDLDQIIAYYESPVGKKDIAASHAGIPKWSAYLAEKNQAALKQATSTYVTSVKNAVERARARKK